MSFVQTIMAGGFVSAIGRPADVLVRGFEVLFQAIQYKVLQALQALGLLQRMIFSLESSLSKQFPAPYGYFAILPKRKAPPCYNIRSTELVSRLGFLENNRAEGAST